MSVKTVKNNKKLFKAGKILINLLKYYEYKFES